MALVRHFLEKVSLQQYSCRIKKISIFCCVRLPSSLWCCPTHGCPLWNIIGRGKYCCLQLFSFTDHCVRWIIIRALNKWIATIYCIAEQTPLQVHGLIWLIFYLCLLFIKVLDEISRTLCHLDVKAHILRFAKWWQNNRTPQNWRYY